MDIKIVEIIGYRDRDRSNNIVPQDSCEIVRELAEEARRANRPKKLVQCLESYAGILENARMVREKSFRLRSRN